MKYILSVIAVLLCCFTLSAGPSNTSVITSDAEESFTLTDIQSDAVHIAPETVIVDAQIEESVTIKVALCYQLPAPNVAKAIQIVTPAEGGRSSPAYSVKIGDYSLNKKPSIERRYFATLDVGRCAFV